MDACGACNGCKQYTTCHQSDILITCPNLYQASWKSNGDGIGCPEACVCNPWSHGKQGQTANTCTVGCYWG